MESLIGCYRVLNSEIQHGEVVKVVREQDGAVGSRRPGDESVRRMDRPAPAGPLRLVPAGGPSGLAV